MSIERINHELASLKRRVDELNTYILPDLQGKTESMYAHIILLDKGSEERERLEHEFHLLAKELRIRSDEVFDLRRQMEQLEHQKKQQVR